MLPQGLRVIDASIESSTEMPSRTYKLDLQQKRIIGYVDNLEAVAQAVHKLFLTERYAWEIYSQAYGVEFESFLGQSTDFVLAIFESRVRDAVAADDRIRGIKDFKVNKTDISTIVASCTVITTQGTFEIREELSF
mgnify:CR=1 FL=1